MPTPTSTPEPVEMTGFPQIHVSAPTQNLVEREDTRLTVSLFGLEAPGDYTVVLRSDHHGFGFDLGCARSRVIRHSAPRPDHKLDVPLYTCGAPGGHVTGELRRGDNPTSRKRPSRT